jgi:hypothetical protein
MERTMVETQRIVEWLQHLVHIPGVGPRNAGLRSGAIEPKPGTVETE